MEKPFDLLLAEYMASDINRSSFWMYRNRHGQEVGEITRNIKQVLSENNLSASEAIGLMDYMKLAITSSSFLPKD